MSLEEKVYFKPSEKDKCKKRILWRNGSKLSNPKFKTFNQLLYTAGDRNDFYRHAHLSSLTLNATFQRQCEPNKTCNTRNANAKTDIVANADTNVSLNPFYQKINVVSTLNTFNYMFDKFKKGVYVQIKNNKVTVFLPFSNAYYKNNWYHRLHISPTDKIVLDKMYKIEQSITAKKTGQNDDFIAHHPNWHKFKALEQQATQNFAKYVQTQRKTTTDNWRGINYNRRHWYANNCFFRNSFPAWEGDKQTALYLHMLTTLVNQRSIGDVEFFLHLRDFPILRTDRTEPYVAIWGQGQPVEPQHRSHFTPILGQGSADGFADIPMPNQDDWMNITKYIYPEDCKEGPDIGTFETNWDNKKSMLVFRGSATGCGVDERSNIRLFARKMARHTKHISTKFGKIDLNVGITNWKARLMFNGEFQFKKPHGPLDQHMSMAEQSTCKYILHLDGHVAAFRLSTELAMGSVVLKQASQYHVWFEAWLKPWVHFVPLQSDLADLQDKLQWCAAHDDKCKTIANNALHFFRTYLSQNFILDYWQAMLNKIHLQYTPLPNSIIPNTPSTSQSSFAIIVPFRDTGDGSRFKELQTFHAFIQQHLSNAVIYCIEQHASPKEQKFNRGYLLNIGYRIASAHHTHSHYIFHDVDNLPCIHLMQLYRMFPKTPMALATRGTRYEQPSFYTGDALKELAHNRKLKKQRPFMGGVISINGKDFETVNGFPNDFWGWGGEDDELSHRMAHHGLCVQVPRSGRVIDVEADITTSSLSIADKMTLLKSTDAKNMLKFELLKAHKKNNHANGLCDVNISKHDVQLRRFHGCTIYSVQLLDTFQVEQ